METHTYTQHNILTSAHIQICTQTVHTNLHTHAHTQTQTDRHTHTHTHTCMHAQSQLQVCTQKVRSYQI